MERSPAHRPVLPAEVARLLHVDRQGCLVIVDCTVGLGGHAEMLLSKAGKDARLIGIDFDESNLRFARRRLERFGRAVRLFQANFADVGEVMRQASADAADALLADLGAASSQLDDPDRGFSFQTDGPLDMRMDTGSGQTAAQLVNDLDERELADLIYSFGQERYSRRIAHAIAAARSRERIERTGELARIVAGAIPAPARAKRHGVHPATRTFQALRIAVNKELDNLERLLEALPATLAPSGRAAIISFHSLEDRLVKQAFKSMADSGQAELLTAKPIGAAAAEQAENPRSRSAKLRGIGRIA